LFTEILGSIKTVVELFYNSVLSLALHSLQMVRSERALAHSIKAASNNIPWLLIPCLYAGQF
jgi:hypothetical protein